MRAVPRLIIVVAAMVLLPSVWGEQVLGSFTTWGLVGSAPGFDDSARFIIGHGSDVFDINPLGDDRLVLPSASTQSFTYRSDADDPNYSAMVTRLTNGTNDPVSIFLAFGHCVTRSGLVISESSAFLVLSDFVGCRITGLRVIIDPFRIGPWSAGGTIIEHPYGGEFRYRWEVLGEPPLPPVTAHYVNLNSAHPSPPYTNWATAARDIQTAVDVAEPGALVIVNDGVYATGGRAVYGTMTNRVAIDRAITVQSVHGPGATVIQGAWVPGATNGNGAIRCVYLTNGAVLTGFTLTNGATRSVGDASRERCGGGLWCDAASAVVSNCVVTGNSASYHGGGVYGGTLNSCTLTANSASSGGGVHSGTLNNCTLTGNSAVSGGGAGNAALNNCILYFNTATASGPNHHYDPPPNGTSPINSCCTTPMPSSGAGNITNAPAFLDYAGGNLRLQTNSPCINAGNNACTQGSTDLDGRPRIASGTVDIGAYEFQPGVSGSFIGWLQQYGLPTDGSADYAQSDQDGMNNWLEFCTGTNPTNSLSALRLVSVTRNGSSLTVTWQSVTNQTYFLERSIGLRGYPSFLTLATSIPGQWGMTTYTDTNAAGRGPVFYRVGVQPAGWQMPSGGSIISYAWLQQYGLPTDGSADHADPDDDGLNNWQEWQAATIPTNAASALRMLSATRTVSGVTVAWSSVAGRSYSLERATEMGASPDFSLLRSNIAGQTGTTSWTDTNAVGAAPRFYRVRVEP